MLIVCRSRHNGKGNGRKGAFGIYNPQEASRMKLRDTENNRTNKMMKGKIRKPRE
jgi:hypothetical protein